MKKIFRVAGLVLRFNQIAFGAAAAALIVASAFAAMLGVYYLVLRSRLPNPLPLPHGDMIPFVAFFLIAAIIDICLHYRIFSLGTRIVNRVRSGKFGTDDDLNTLGKLRIAFLYTFITSLLLTAASYPATKAMRSSPDQTIKASSLAFADLVQLVTQFFFIRFDGLNSLFAALLVFAIENFLRENRAIKNELDQVI